MMECSAVWQAVTRIDETPLTHRCQCRRPPGHEGAHRCVCEPINFFTMRYASEHRDA